MTTSTGASMDIGIDEHQRRAIADGLRGLCADTFTLYLKTHYFHWNVTGPMFETLHLMFERQYNELWTSVDEIAERIRALGFPAPGTYAEFSRMGSVRETEEIPPADQMVQLLVDGHEAVTRDARSLSGLAEEAGDQATLDLLTERMQSHEKTAWMLRALLE